MSIVQLDIAYEYYTLNSTIVESNSQQIFFAVKCQIKKHPKMQIENVCIKFSLHCLGI